MKVFQLENVEKALTYSRDKLSNFRLALESRFSIRTDFAVIVVGSFGRGEASEHSDFDYYVLVPGTSPDFAPLGDVVDAIREISSQLGLRPPAKDGAFGSCVSSEVITAQIGGMGDLNQNLTQRMLFLFESKCIFNANFYDSMFDTLVNRYVRDEIKQHHLCRFLLNDLIRYYRTICVDFEHKTFVDGKPWGDRNIKLMFSRKLLYFSGILTIAETAQRSCESKRYVLKMYLQMPPLERIEMICGTAAEAVFRRYDKFLGRLSEKHWREVLVETTSDRNEHEEEFRDFKNQGHRFTWELSKLLKNKYDDAHPIHNAIRF